MSTQRLHAWMDCASCGGNRSHEIVYVGRLMLSIRCSECGAEVTMHRGHLVQDWFNDLSDRLAAKRHQIWTDARSDPRSFVLALPGRVVRQPAKLADELNTVLTQRRRRAS